MLFIGGLFPQFSSSDANVGKGTTVIDQGGVRRMTAVLMALNSINNNNTVLPQTKVRCKLILWCAVCCNMNLIVGRCVCVFVKLELVIGDSKRQERNAMAKAYRHHDRGSVALIGPASSGPTQAVARWLSMPEVKPHRLLIGYSATSAELRKKEFSNFLRTPPADDIQAESMATLMKGLLVDAL